MTLVAQQSVTAGSDEVDSGSAHSSNYSQGYTGSGCDEKSSQHISSSSNSSSNSSSMDDHGSRRASATQTADANGEKLAKTFQPAVIDWAHIDKTRFYTLAPLAGILTRIVLYPTALVKTRLQVQKQVQRRSKCGGEEP